MFCYGTGGLMSLKKKKKLSYREHVCHLLNLNCDRFWKHRSFIFVVFNIIQRNENRLFINLLVKRNDFNVFVKLINKLTIDDLKKSQ